MIDDGWTDMLPKNVKYQIQIIETAPGKYQYRMDTDSGSSVICHDRMEGIGDVLKSLITVLVHWECHADPRCLAFLETGVEAKDPPNTVWKKFLSVFS